MKPASIISLIVAAVIIVIGIVTCTVANSKANQSGNLLFAETRGEDSVNTIDISGRDLIKVSLNFGDADVSIYGTTGESYIEFINFPESFTSVKTSNTSVSFNEISNIFSMFKFWENDFSFKGMRYFLTPSAYDNSKKKSIHIYLSQNSGIKQIELNADRSFISIDNISLKADLFLNADDIDIFASSAITRSALRVNTGTEISPAQKAKITLKDSEFANITVSASELIFTGTSSYSHNADLSASSGKVNWDLHSPVDTVSAINEPEISIVTTGKISVNNGEEISPYSHKSNLEEADRHLVFDLGSSDISIIIPFDSNISAEN